VDITEDDHEYLFKADLPEKKKFHRVERFFGTFERTFTVPEDADPTKIVAEFHDGVLQVHLPKRPMPKPKTIEVKVQ
jgi:HSP20 family protein